MTSLLISEISSRAEFLKSPVGYSDTGRELPRDWPWDGGDEAELDFSTIAGAAGGGTWSFFPAGWK